MHLPKYIQTNHPNNKNKDISLLCCLSYVWNSVKIGICPNIKHLLWRKKYLYFVNKKCNPCSYRRVLHRDLKTRNIFLKKNMIKIGDFGISRVLMGTTDMAQHIHWDAVLHEPRGISNTRDTTANRTSGKI